jgi:hypothetical protein
MKTICILILILTSYIGIGQTIGVATVKTFGLVATQELTSKMAQLEIIKLNKYQVLDKFDMLEISDVEKYKTCYGKTCLIEYGKALNVDYILAGNIDKLVNKIIVNFKIIDINSSQIIKTHAVEFNSQEAELQRMIGIVLKEMHDMPVDPLLKRSLAFNNEVITSNNVGRVNNSGPRVGLAYTVGTMNQFLQRDKSEGGLDISPLVSNLGYQFEGQYVGTENFSALLECLINFTGLEQGKFIPSVSLLNGFRFGSKGWEFAFGPSFGLAKTSMGFFTEDGLNTFGKESGRYWTEREFNNSAFSESSSLEEYGYDLTKNLDARGDVNISTRWIMAFGRTFKSGALNIPVNVFYSSQKGGGMAGLSVGFNVTRMKSNIN